MSVKIEELLDSSNVTKKNIDFHKNEIIFSQGDPAKAVFYLRKGLVRLSVTSHTGKEAIVEMLRPGDFFGTWCLAEHPLRMATATAMEHDHSVHDQQEPDTSNPKYQPRALCWFHLMPPGKEYSNRTRLSESVIEFGREAARSETSAVKPVRNPRQDWHNAPQSSHPKAAGGDDWNHT